MGRIGWIRNRIPRNGKPRRFDPAGFPCFKSEDLKHKFKVGAFSKVASPFSTATRHPQKKTVDKSAIDRSSEAETIGTQVSSMR